MIKAGFVVNTEKFVWVPQKCLEWLGFIWNKEEGCLELPSVKVEKLLFMINNILDNDFWVTARYLAKITGKIVSFSESLGSVCRFMTRQLHLTICFRRSWDTVLKLNKESIIDLNFWRLNCMNLPFINFFTTIFYQKD